MLSLSGPYALVITAAKDVSRPLKPLGAQQNSWSFSSYACGAWSVIIASIVPSFKPSNNAWRWSSERIGGAILNAGLYSRKYSSVKDKCWLVTSHVTLRPFAFARRTISTVFLLLT